MQRNAIMLISRIHEAADKWIAAELAAAGLKGVVPSHGDVLALLFRQREATMHELAEFARRTKPTMTVLVGKLERMGLVRRSQSPLDARCQIVRLTPEGEKLRPAFDEVHRWKHLTHPDIGQNNNKEKRDEESMLGHIRNPPHPPAGHPPFGQGSREADKAERGKMEGIPTSPRSRTR
jgi:DNA-binding MarR family transcriptional regulator